MPESQKKELFPQVLPMYVAYNAFAFSCFNAGGKSDLPTFL